MNVGDFLELQGAFERDGVVDATAKIKKIGVTKELPCQSFVESRFIRLQDGFNFVRNAREFLHESSSSGLVHLAAHLAKVGSEQEKRSHLRGESLGRGHANLRTGVRRNRTAGFASDHRTNHIANRKRWGALEFCFALGGQRVRGFTGLADADGQSF